MYKRLVSTMILPVGSSCTMCAIHGPRRGPFEIDAFAVVAAAVARALELVFGGLPLRRAAQMGAARENHEDAVRLAHHPDAIGHQEALVDAQGEIGGIADMKIGIGFVQRAGKEKPQEHQEIDAEISPNDRPRRCGDGSD